MRTVMRKTDRLYSEQKSEWYPGTSNFLTDDFAMVILQEENIFQSMLTEL